MHVDGILLKCWQRVITINCRQ